MYPRPPLPLQSYLTIDLPVLARAGGDRGIMVAVAAEVVLSSRGTRRWSRLIGLGCVRDAKLFKVTPSMAAARRRTADGHAHRVSYRGRMSSASKLATVCHRVGCRLHCYYYSMHNVNPLSVEQAGRHILPDCVPLRLDRLAGVPRWLRYRTHASPSAPRRSAVAMVL